MIDLINKLKQVFYKLECTDKEVKKAKAELEPLFEKCGFRKEIPNKPKIVIFMINGIGDAICASEALIRIKEKYPESEITLFSTKTVKELYFACPLIDNYEEFDIKKDRNTYHRFFNFFKLCFQNHYDIGYVFSLDPRLYRLVYLAGINKIYGLNITSDSPFVYFDDKQVLCEKYFVNNIYSPKKKYTCAQEFANMVIEKDDKFNLSLWISPSSLRKVEEYTESDNNIAIGLSSNIKMKKYPFYDKILTMLYEMNPNFKFFIFGGESELEDDLLEKILECKNVVSLVGKLSIHESIAMLSKCKYYIGNDTWLSHASGALSIPSLVLMPYPANKKFSKYSPPIYMPPLNSPSIIVLPKTAGSKECMEKNFYLGCAIVITEDKPCCIKNIQPETVVKSFVELQALKEPITMYRS